MGEINSVRWSKKVEKELSRLPPQVQRKFYAWVTTIRLAGLRLTRQRPGFHDEPLTGDRRGQRSVRLNVAYRAIYVERGGAVEEWIEVLEVNHHEY